jgi:hypothetical protein
LKKLNCPQKLLLLNEKDHTMKTRLQLYTPPLRTLKLFIILTLLFIGPARITPASFTATADSTNAEPASTAAVKWHPGHYLTYMYDGQNTLDKLANLSDSRYDKIAGVKVKIHWGLLEETQGEIHFEIIDAMLNALPEDKALLPLILDRDFHIQCGSARLPDYVVHHPTYPAKSFADGNGCVPQVWEAEINDLKIAFYAAIGKHYDTNPRFEGFMIEETALSLDSGTYSKSDLRDEYIRLNSEVRAAMPHTHMFQGMNWLGGSHRCDNLRQLAEHFRTSTGSGITNPDTVPWRAKPLPGDDCSEKISGDFTDIPVYHIYRDYKNILPIAVGNDTSQLGDPGNPDTFNGKPMTMPNLVEAIYKMSMEGFNQDGEWIEGFGANYILWNAGFWSIEGGSQKGWEDAVLDFVNQPGHDTNHTCPSALICTDQPTPEPAFADVPPSHPNFEDVELLYEKGYTAGCSTDPLLYCPDQVMNRAESAVFVGRGIHGVDRLPEDPGTQDFADLDLASWAAKWAAALYEDGFTSGCGNDPLIFCPWQGHTRAEGAVFYLRMLHGADYLPPDPAYIFSDVQSSFWAARWVEAAYLDGILPACNDEPLMICPEGALTRGLAAHMMVAAKQLE